MVNVRDKSCIHPECKIYPVFNYPGEKTRLYCKLHALSGMCDVKSDSCIEKNCNTRASFNFIGNKKGMMCSLHKTDGMMNIKSSKCEEIDCMTIALFNFPGKKKGVFCSKHAQENMTNVVDKKCIFTDCNINPYFNYPDKKTPMYCNTHKDKTMIDVKSSKFTCTSCNLEWGKTNKSQTLCWYCNPIKRHKSKEEEIKKLLEFKNIKFINDKSVANDCCLKYRPDFLIDCGSYFLVLEVDEYAHSSYSKDCEIVRMNNISYSLGLPVKFIRYNPDNKDYDKKHKQTKLIEEINKYIYKETLVDLEPIYLFY